jgi:hypothetical protein
LQGLFLHQVPVGGNAGHAGKLDRPVMAGVGDAFFFAMGEIDVELQKDSTPGLEA